MASRAPSAGAGMLPLSPRRPRTLWQQEPPNGKAISPPILSHSLGQPPAHPRRLWFKVRLWVNNNNNDNNNNNYNSINNMPVWGADEVLKTGSSSCCIHATFFYFILKKNLTSHDRVSPCWYVVYSFLHVKIKPVNNCNIFKYWPLGLWDHNNHF